MKLITSVMVGAVCAAGWACVAFLACLLDPGLPAITIVVLAGAAFVGGAGYYGLCANGGQHEKK